MSDNNNTFPKTNEGEYKSLHNKEEEEKMTNNLQENDSSSCPGYNPSVDQNIYQQMADGNEIANTDATSTRDQIPSSSAKEANEDNESPQAPPYESSISACNLKHTSLIVRRSIKKKKNSSSKYFSQASKNGLKEKKYMMKVHARRAINEEIKEKDKLIILNKDESKQEASFGVHEDTKNFIQNSQIEDNFELENNQRDFGTSTIASQASSTSSSSESFQELFGMLETNPENRLNIETSSPSVVIRSEPEFDILDSVENSMSISSGQFLNIINSSPDDEESSRNEILFGSQEITVQNLLSESTSSLSISGQ